LFDYRILFLRKKFQPYRSSKVVQYTFGYFSLKC
jgi:hypothetical protein